MLRFVDAKYSNQQLMQWKERVTDGIPYWRGRGVWISSTAAAVDGSGVGIGVPDLDAVRGDLDARYRPMTLHLVRLDSRGSSI
ncbi:hypothetical protein ACFW1A_10545 [Kitasatospora sp. NPDC058965]|uniref:hypothetical protein n=1 Tax=Kitasatospora sp. NPDC058965 TaxID=3346682 RepID=UPI0036A0D3E7